MINQQTENTTKILSILNKILTEPISNQINKQAQEKLISISKKAKYMTFILKMIEQSLINNQSVIIRLKMLCLVHQLVSSHISEESMEFSNFIIQAHQKRTKNRVLGSQNSADMSNYLQINVQLPYLLFLRKIICWELMDKSEEQLNMIDFGFSLLNKIKDILQLKKMFHNFGCYYPNHKYAINMFKSTIFNIIKLWNKIFEIVKQVTDYVIKENNISSQKYLFICNAQEIQDRLMEIIYGGYFSKKLTKEQKIKHVSLIKPEIKLLQIERKKKEISNKAFQLLISKRSSRLQFKKTQKMTKPSESFEEKLDTDMQIELLDSILRLQSLLNV